jgi:hypothetical protein
MGSPIPALERWESSPPAPHGFSGVRMHAVGGLILNPYHFLMPYT